MVSEWRELKEFNGTGLYGYATTQILGTGISARLVALKADWSQASLRHT